MKKIVKSVMLIVGILGMCTVFANTAITASCQDDYNEIQMQIETYGSFHANNTNVKFTNLMKPRQFGKQCSSIGLHSGFPVCNLGWLAGNWSKTINCYV